MSDSAAALPPDGRGSRSWRCHRCGPQLLRPSARALDAVLHGDVGALQLLRHARVPDPLHDGAGRRRRAGIRRRACGVDLRHLHRQRLGRRRSSAGMVADRLLGQYRSVLLGGIIIAARPLHARVQGAARSSTPASALIVIGTGLLKPNVSTLVGSLYAPGDTRRDAGFSIFYMGINLGAFIGPLVAGYLAQRVDWHLGFASAGVGMVLGLIQYVLGRKRLQPAMARLDQRAGATAVATSPARRARRTGAGFTADEWKRIGAIVVFFLVRRPLLGRATSRPDRRSTCSPTATRGLEVFGFAFPSSWFQSVQPLFVILLAPVFAWLWMRLGRREPSVAGEVRASACSSSALAFLVLVPAGGDRPERRRRAGQPVVAGRVVLRLGARRAVPQPGRPERRHQARAGPHRRPDDGRVVPVERVRQQARRLGGELLQHDAAQHAVHDRDRRPGRRRRC